MYRQLGVILLVLLFAGLVRPVRSTFAQNDSPTEENREKTDVPSGKDSGDSIFVQDDDGNWRSVPLDGHTFGSPTVDGSASDEETQVVSDFFFSKLELDGSAMEDWVELTAMVTVQVVTPDRWLEVPFRFDQGLLLGYRHEGVGEIAAPSADAETEGMLWLLRGKGEHRLQLMLRVPLRKTPAGDLLQLRLPQMQLFTGELTLRLPSNSVTVRTGESMRLRGTHVDGEQTVVTADLPGERVDLRWNILEQQTEPLMLKPTEVTLRLLDDMAELTVRQQIQFGAGQPDSLRVRLPSDGFELSSQGVRIDTREAVRWLQPTTKDESEWVTIPLGGLVDNQVQLDWRFSAPIPEAGRDIVIDGLEIAGAQRQNGTIAIESTDRYRVTHVGEDDVGVKRIDVDDLPTSPTLSSHAYSFSGGQYRLRMRVEPTVPSVSATPYYFVKVSQDRVELEAVYQLSVDGGPVRSVPIIWKGEDRIFWDVSASPLTAGVPRETLRDDVDDADSPRKWELALPEIVDNRTVAGFSAVRYFDTIPPEETIALSLPMVSGARAISGWIVVATDDDVELMTRPGEHTVLTRQADTTLSGLRVPLPDWTGTQRLTPYRFSVNSLDAAPRLETDVTVQSQSLTTSTIVQLNDLDRQPRVSQRLSYDVQFGRLSRVRLKIPPLLFEQLPIGFQSQSLKFLLDGDVHLPSTWSGAEVTVELPTPRLGKFDIIVDDYVVENDSLRQTRVSGPETLNVPIISSLDEPFSSVQLIVPDQETMAVDMADPRWTRITTAANGLHWITGQSVTDVPISLDRSLDRSPQRLTIDSAFLQTEIDDTGHHVTRATYVVRDTTDTLVLQLPEEARNQIFHWNGSELEDSNVLRLSDTQQQYRLERPVDLLDGLERSPRQVVSIRYDSPGTAVQWSQAQTVRFPVFAEDVWIERMWWELKLPPAQHLFVPPSTMTPQFQWERLAYTFWERKPTTDYEDFRKSMLGSDVDEPSTSTNSGNVYPFVRFGSPTEVHFRMLSKSVIVFLGAGLTLVASFLLLKVPAARHPLLWLPVGLAIMAASLWYLEPMLLLLQPAAYGLILPICAALLDYATNGRRTLARMPAPDTTFREVAMGSGSGFSGLGPREPQVTTTHVRPTALTDSGIEE